MAYYYSNFYRCPAFIPASRCPVSPSNTNISRTPEPPMQSPRSEVFCDCTYGRAPMPPNYAFPAQNNNINVYNTDGNDVVDSIVANEKRLTIIGDQTLVKISKFVLQQFFAGRLPLPIQETNKPEKVPFTERNKNIPVIPIAAIKKEPKLEISVPRPIVKKFPSEFMRKLAMSPFCIEPPKNFEEIKKEHPNVVCRDGHYNFAHALQLN